MRRYLPTLRATPSEWHPRLATIIALGFLTTVFTILLYPLVARNPLLASTVFVVGLFGFGIFMVSGLAYASAVLRDMFAG